MESAETNNTIGRKDLGIIKYIIAFVLSVIFGISLLLLAACFPNQPINNRVHQSAVALLPEGDYYALSDKSDASVLDNFSDALMLMESKSMVISDPSTVLTNPKYTYEDSVVESLVQYTNNDNEEPTSYYSRYWMGFRAVLRPMLAFLSYQEIRLYNAYFLFFLMFSVTVSLAKRVSTKAALTFAVSIILVRPHIICNSLQFSNCFLIALSTMLLVPLVVKYPQWQRLFFMEIGLATMFFDFYTTPLITFALPAIYLWLLSRKGKNQINTRQILVNLTLWLTGYAMMWISKLVLTDVFTSTAGLRTGLLKLAGWTTGPVVGQGVLITPMVTVYRIVAAVVADFEGVMIWGIAIAVLMIYLFAFPTNRKKTIANIKNNFQVMIFAAFACAWFAVAYKPTAVHYYFQYRSVVIIFWSLLLLVFESNEYGQVLSSEKDGN